jgi:hypothetical protein
MAAVTSHECIMLMQACRSAIAGDQAAGSVATTVVSAVREARRAVALVCGVRPARLVLVAGSDRRVGWFMSAGGASPYWGHITVQRLTPQSSTTRRQHSARCRHQQPAWS